MGTKQKQQREEQKGEVMNHDGRLGSGKGRFRERERVKRDGTYHDGGGGNAGSDLNNGGLEAGKHLYVAKQAAPR